MSFPSPTPWQARLIWLGLTGLAIALLAALVVALVWGLGKVLHLLSPVLWPLAVAGVLSYLLDPVVDFIERKKAGRARAIVIVFALALAILTALFGSIVPQLITETSRLATKIPDYSARIEERIEHWASHPPPLLKKFLERDTEGEVKEAPPSPPDQSSGGATTNAAPPAASASPRNPARLTGSLDTGALQSAAGWLGGSLRQISAWLFSRAISVLGVLAGLALIPVYTFYFLLEKRGISSRWTDYLPLADSAFKTELVFVLNSINNYLITFFRGQVLVAICDGTLYGLGFLIIGLPYALLIGAGAILLTMIPFVGAIVTCCSAFIIAVVQFGDWLHPLLVLVVFGCVQSLEGLVISPRIMGGRVGLHPVTIIIAVMVGTTLLGGLLGGILAIPLTAALRVVLGRYVWKRAVTGDSKSISAKFD
jgi:predicted PurR-regulated permease PerM